MGLNVPKPNRAITQEEVKEREAKWMAGIGPSKVWDAMGWSEEEWKTYKATGDVPMLTGDAIESGFVKIDMIASNPFLQGVTPHGTPIELPDGNQDERHVTFGDLYRPLVDADIHKMQVDPFERFHNKPALPDLNADTGEITFSLKGPLPADDWTVDAFPELETLYQTIVQETADGREKLLAEILPGRVWRALSFWETVPETSPQDHGGLGWRVENRAGELCDEPHHFGAWAESWKRSAVLNSMERKMAKEAEDAAMHDTDKETTAP